LHELYGYVFIPQAVLEELNHPKAPEEVRAWVAKLPSWVEALRPDGEIPSSFLPELDRGERHALKLAIETNADMLLADDNAAVHAAQRFGLQVSRTISLLGDAAEAGLLDFDASIERLRRTNFRIEPDVIAQVRRRVVSRN
jgi:uncharacterized protein